MPHKKDNLEHKFNQLADQWEKNVQNISSLSQRLKHGTYLEILSMGEIIVPFIHRRQKHKPGLWDNALRTFTKEL